MGKNRILPVLIILVLLFSCSIDYGDSILPDKMMDDIPDNILYNFLYTESSNGNRNFSIYAEKAEIFNTRKQTVLTEVVFQQYDSAGAVITEGKADKCLIFTETNDAELTGNLIIYSSGEEAEIATSYLFWNNGDKTLTGKQDRTITIRKDSGTVISGSDFSADMKTKSYNLGNGVSGKYVYEEN